MTDTSSSSHKSDRDSDSDSISTANLKTTHAERLADMLGVALNAGKDSPPDPTELTAELLQERLDGPLPPDPTAAAKLPSILDHIYNELVPGGRRSLGEALAEPNTDLATLVRIKDHAKKTAAPNCPEPQRTISITVYYTAIASALLFHGRKITTYSYDALASALGKLDGKPWIPMVLGKRLQAAQQFCRDHKD